MPESPTPNPSPPRAGARAGRGSPAECSMPKIDIDKIQPDTSTGYPSPFNKAVEGRSRKRLARFAGLTQFGVNICTLKPGAASSQRHCHEKED